MQPFALRAAVVLPIMTLRRAGLVSLLVVVACRSVASSGSAPPASGSEDSVSPPEEPRAIPADLEDRIDKSERLGFELFRIDRAAALGTDLLFDRVGGPPPGVVGYLPVRSVGESGEPVFLVFFYDDDDPPRIHYTVKAPLNGTAKLEVHSPPTEGPDEFTRMVRARQVAIDALPATPQPLNPVVLPGSYLEEEGFAVYLLAGTTKPNLAVLGRHYLALVSEDGTAVRSLTPLSKAILEFPLQENALFLTVTHIVTDYPLETHVFASRLHDLTLYVGTARGIWKIKEGDISFLGTYEELRDK